MQCMNIDEIINYYKWEALKVINFLRGKERKNMSEGKKKDCAFACPCLELSLFMLSNTVYQHIELT